MAAGNPLKEKRFGHVPSRFFLAVQPMAITDGMTVRVGINQTPAHVIHGAMQGQFLPADNIAFGRIRLSKFFNLKICTFHNISPFNITWNA